MTSERVGALAQITPAKIAAAAAQVRSGRVVSLNRPLGGAAPVGRPMFTRTSRQINDRRELAFGGHAYINDDVVSLPTQGSSQWDGLAHFGADVAGVPGVFFGGLGLDEIGPDGAARTLGIERYAPGIVTRGVLLDAVTHLAGPDASSLPEDAVIDAAAVEGMLARQQVVLEPGDAVLIFTGFERVLAEAHGVFPTRMAGIDASTVPIWEVARISALAADNVAVEAMPPDFSVHVRLLRERGIPLGELWALEALRDACREEGRHDFLLVSVPLVIPGGHGSTANAVAIF
jgi:kynurenine formamidase